LTHPDAEKAPATQPMPTTEAPPPSPSTEGQSPSPRRDTPGARRRRGRDGLEGLENYDLIHVIDELEDERSRVQLREKIWIALILHLVIFLILLFLPRYLPQVKVRDNSQMDKKMTYLELPPDALKQLKPKVPAPQSDKNRQQEAPHPVPNKATEAMRKAGPPTPRPAPPAQQPQPTPKAQQAPPPPQPAPEPKPTPPAPKSQNSPVEAPSPQPTKPNFNTAPKTPAEAMQQAERQASRGSTSYGGGDMGANAPSQHAGTTGAVDVLSDTLGVDFGPYIQRVIYDTKRAWYPIIPEVAQPPISKQGRVLIRFKILPDGSVKEMHLEGPSGDVSLDRAAWGGILGASPFPNLPKNFKGPFLELRFYFLYNDKDGIR
jgi:TonB family protein